LREGGAGEKRESGDGQGVMEKFHMARMRRKCFRSGFRRHEG
jgi:hypothetical protein